MPAPRPTLSLDRQAAPQWPALSRTCTLHDFPDCLTVANWQQRLAEVAWTVWLGTSAGDPLVFAPSIVVNLSGVDFVAPGPPTAIACTPEERPHVDAPALYALCVLDHIEAPGKFLSQAIEILQPQGLLFLTFAYWNAEGPDTASGAAGRRRIYSVLSYQKLIREARKLGFENFGGTDWAYHGSVLDDHTLASLVLRRRERQ